MDRGICDENINLLHYSVLGFNFTVVFLRMPRGKRKVSDDPPPVKHESEDDDPDVAHEFQFFTDGSVMTLRNAQQLIGVKVARYWPAGKPTSFLVVGSCTMLIFAPFPLQLKTSKRITTQP